MSNPYEYREIMQAAMAYGTDESVEQVLARHKARHEQEAKDAKSGRKSGTVTTAPRPSAAPALSEMEKLKAMVANAPARPQRYSELDSPPDE